MPDRDTDEGKTNTVMEGNYNEMAGLNPILSVVE